MKGRPDGRSAALADRAHCLLGAIGVVEPANRGRDIAEMCAAVDGTLGGARSDLYWLALSVMSSKIADVASVEQACRYIRCGVAAGDVLADSLETSGCLDTETWLPVSVHRGGVLVDVEQASRNSLGTGIQRVVRQSARRWARHPETTLVGWTKGYEGLRNLSTDEVSLATGGTEVPSPTVRLSRAARTSMPRPSSIVDSPHTTLIPWRSTIVVPELAVERSRPEALAGIARFARCSTGIIGHDCVPLTMAETALEHVPVAYLRYLAACAHATRLAPTSRTSALEFRGWHSTLASRGLQGPDIRTVELATEVPPSALCEVPADQRESLPSEIAGLLEASNVPIVLVVGSHEPRKNQMTVLHSAELLWRQGEQFSLLFLGGNSWHSEPFFNRLEELRSQGRMIETLNDPPDHVVWSAYRSAACSVFVSLHEGFGLPIVESLACGTPVITSCYGAMADNARHGGCLLVDPRDPHQVADAISRVLTEGCLRDRLSREASAIPARTWDTYAEETWDFLVNGRAPK